jgi:hypothetical protein
VSWGGGGQEHILNTPAFANAKILEDLRAFVNAF